MDEGLRMIFTKNLNRYLAANGLTQADMARYMKVSTTTAAKWCNAQAMPRIDKVQSLCNWFRCQKSDLLEDKRNTEVTPISESVRAERAKRFLDYYERLSTGEQTAVNKIMGIDEL